MQPGQYFTSRTLGCIAGVAPTYISCHVRAPTGTEKEKIMKEGLRYVPVCMCACICIFVHVRNVYISLYACVDRGRCILFPILQVCVFVCAHVYVCLFTYGHVYVCM